VIDRRKRVHTALDATSESTMSPKQTNTIQTDESGQNQQIASAAHGAVKRKSESAINVRR
jgi:hypothetical protein